MVTTPNPQETLKYQVGLALFLAISLAAGFGILFHASQPDAHVVNKVLPPIMGVVSVVAFIFFYRHPNRYSKLAPIIPIVMALPLLIPSTFFIVQAFYSAEIRLIDSYPPFTAALLLWTTITFVFIPSQYLLKVVGVGWIIWAGPILVYLGLHPEELQQPRGLDLLIFLGPAMVIQIVMVLFYSRLQREIERLSNERLQYYSKVIESQAIRQEAMEQAATQFHNGPLQSLAVLLRELEQGAVPYAEVQQRLNHLNGEIRAVSRSLVQSTELAQPHLLFTQGDELTLRLGAGTQLELSLPFHTLMYEVYAATLKRDLPCFKTIQVKVRNFAPLAGDALSLDLKREIGLWLEEALCNAGKHAQGATRIQVTGAAQGGQYCLQVVDNGSGLHPNSTQQGTQQSQRLAQRLGGTFQRRLGDKGGVICTLTWPMQS